MDEKAFRKEVERCVNLDEVSPESVEFALSFCQKQGWTEQSHRSICVELAGHYEQQRALHPASSEAVDRLLPLTGDPSAESTDRLQRILPTVKQVRQQLFGLEDAPFTSDADAATWIEREGEQQDVSILFDSRGGKGWRDQRPEHIKQQMSMLKQGIDAGIQQYIRISGETAPAFQPQWSWLPYMRPSLQPDGTKALLAEEFPVCPGSPLARLYEVSHALAQATGLTQCGVVRSILLGTLPTLPRYRVHMRHAPGTLEDLEDLSAVIDVFTPYLTDTDLRDIRHYLHHHMESERLKQLRTFHEQLLRLVDAHGPVPHGQGSGAGAYWQGFLSRWNREVHTKRQEAEHTGAVYTLKCYDTPDALRVAWNRLPLQRRVPRKKEPTPPRVSIRFDVVGDAAAVERLRRLGKAGE